MYLMLAYHRAVSIFWPMPTMILYSDMSICSNSCCCGTPCCRRRWWQWCTGVAQTHCELVDNN